MLLYAPVSMIGMAEDRNRSGSGSSRGRRRTESVTNHEPSNGRRQFGTPARARGFLIGNILWFGGFLALVIAVPDGQKGGNSSPVGFLTIVPMIVGFVLLERGVMAMSRASGGSGWNPSFSTRIRAMSPATYRAAAQESSLPAVPVLIGVSVLVGAAVLVSLAAIVRA